MDAVLARRTPLANPWLWVGIGAALTLGAAAGSRAVDASAVVAAMVVAGLALVGIGMTIRLNSRSVTSIGAFPPARTIALTALTLFQLAVAALTTWSLIASFVGIDPLDPARSTLMSPPPIHPGLGVILWCMVVPLAICGTLRTVTQLSKPDEWTWSQDSAALLMVSAVATFAAGFAFSDGENARTLPFFLGVLTAFLASMVSFTLVSITWQRVLLSVAIVLHFAAILNATLAAPPASWLLRQTWTRFARPYLEFMYLNNAYHFYSPDPGPATYLWFRVFYDTGEKNPETGEPKLLGKWVKIPDVDENGSHNYRVALEYQRHLSLTEQVISAEPTPPLYYRSIDGKSLPQPQPFFALRLLNSPEATMIQNEQLVGRDMPKTVMSVPFHKFIANEQQYQKPSLSSQRMLETYVRHVAKTAVDPTRNLPIHSIKVYRVPHMISPWNVFVAGMEPTDPEFYQPYYMGAYTTEGKLIDPNEPLLYWLLPIVRRDQTNPMSLIENYAAVHAGDPEWIYDPKVRRWMREDGHGLGQGLGQGIGKGKERLP